MNTSWKLDASIFMEFFSLIIIGWTWLEIATKAHEMLFLEIVITEIFPLAISEVAV